MKLSKTYVNERSGLCNILNGPFGRIIAPLDRVENPYDLIRLQDANNWFFGTVKNEKK